MDSNDCISNKKLSAIKAKVDSGELTYQDIYTTLHEAIDSELDKPFDEIDRDYLDVCQQMMAHLTNTEVYVSKQPQYEKELIQHIKDGEKRHIKRNRTVPALVIAASLLLLAVVGDGILFRQWLEGSSSHDREQYTITGNEVDPGLVNSGYADNKPEEEKEVVTSNFDEVIAVLGYAPPIPAEYPDGWYHKSYFAANVEHIRWFSEDLTSNEQSGIVKYEVRRFSDIPSAKEYFEQNSAGEYHEINGWDVYLTMNIDTPTAIWLDGDTCFSIWGPLSREELLFTIATITKGD